MLTVFNPLFTVITKYQKISARYGAPTPEHGIEMLQHRYHEKLQSFKFQPKFSQCFLKFRDAKPVKLFLSTFCCKTTNRGQVNVLGY
jgi:hypothetical protein